MVIKQCYNYNFNSSGFIKLRCRVKKWEILLLKCKERVLETAGFLCGLIRDKEDSMMGDLKFVDDFALFNLREERMMRMIIYTILVN